VRTSSQVLISSTRSRSDAASDAMVARNAGRPFATIAAWPPFDTTSPNCQ
jgi:hypothetical protein